MEIVGCFVHGIQKSSKGMGVFCYEGSIVGTYVRLKNIELIMIFLWICGRLYTWRSWEKGINPIKDYQTGLWFK